MIERSHLKILLSVRKNGSLSAAADELCLSQSAISHAIKKLEGVMGVKVWTLSGRTIEFTKEGELLLDFATRVLPQFSHLEREIESHKNGLSGLLCIGMECHPCYRWFLKVVRHFIQDLPQVDLDVKQAFQFGGMSALAQKEIDLIITPDPEFSDDFIFHNVMDYELMLVTSQAHVLAQKDFVQPEDLSQDTVLTYPVSKTRLDIYTHFFTPAGIYPKHHKDIESTDIMLELVLANRGITAMPSWFIDDLVAQGLPLAKVRIGKGGVHKNLWVGQRNEPQPPYISSFIKLASSYTEVH